jgi:putative aminopeptidase FrvX
MSDVRAGISTVVFMLTAAAVSVPGHAQSAPALAQAASAKAASPQPAGSTETVAQWIALPAPPGAERAATDIISASMPGWTRDRLGNLVMRRGSGSPVRVVACGLDEAAYVVSEVTADGYIRLQSSGRARRSALWDQFHEGQRIRIITRNGARPAVVAVRSTHLWRARPTSEPIVRVDDLWVDVGARSRAEVAQLGIALLDPVLREWPAWRFADAVAGPAAGDRAGCAAVAAAASLTPGQGETVWVISVQHAFGYVGLQAVLTTLGHTDSLFLVDAALARDTGAAAPEPVTRRAMTGPVARAFASRAGAVVAIGVRSAHPGTLAETVHESDIVALADEVGRASGAGQAPQVPVLALRGVGGAPPPAIGTDSLAGVAKLMATLSDAYGVSGHEGPVRAVVSAAIPAAWRNQPTHVDSSGDLIVSAGPDRDTVVFVAHMDEIGFQITNIAHDGAVTLSQVGGFYSSLWEGQPALLHLTDEARALAATAGCTLAATAASESPVVPAGTLPGIFIPRARATSKEPDTLSAWFGADSAGLAACGVTTGMRLSAYKVASRLATLRFTARAIDDRAGCTALLMALRQIDPARLTHKVIFVWSVREEVGLEGAAAAAAEFGPTVRRVHAIDTFVSSDSPLESPRFAFAPLGDGAALRSLDNSSVTPPDEVARALRLAHAAHVPVQFGTTNGGNDGSVFVPWGAVDVAVGWPLRYSHSPAEVVDLRDIDALGRMVATLAVADQH